jgi:arylsulfatase A-like enzyme
VPFIVYDPDPSADSTRGTIEDRFVEAVDVVPTCLAALAQPANDHLVEGRSLLSLLRDGQTESWRDAVFSELDYSFREARKLLGRKPQECRATMVRTDRWKYVWWQDFRSMLFDLANDPRELRDLGADGAYSHIRREMEGRLAAWLKARKTRVTVDDAYVEARTATHRKHGIHFGVW